MEHYYWHFLFHQNELDTWAAAQKAKGHDASALRNHFQVSLGFSDADYAYIRTSSVRLTAEVKALNAQATAIVAAGPSPTRSERLQALSAKREAETQAEVAYLKQNLSPDKITRLEWLMVAFFTRPNTAPQQTLSPQQSVPSTVKP